MGQASRHLCMKESVWGVGDGGCTEGRGCEETCMENFRKGDVHKGGRSVSEKHEVYEGCMSVWSWRVRVWCG